MSEGSQQQLHHPLWIIREEAVKQWIRSKMSSDVGYFSKSSDQLHYELCLACPLDDCRFHMPRLVLPLRIHLVRSPYIGCSLKRKSVQKIIQQINGFWEQAKIHFDLICVEECVCELPPSIQNDMHVFFKQQLRRVRNWKTKQKLHAERMLMAGMLLSSFRESSASDGPETEICGYDIWFLDMVGDGYQGVCIDRKNRTILMGENSTKGYRKPTRRPHVCLAKTAAHELGHALSLNHPRNRRFADGNPQILSPFQPNLMAGGVDAKGGGGYFLEDWQISAARNSAEMFLEKEQGKPHTKKGSTMTRSWSGTGFQQDAPSVMEDSNRCSFRCSLS